MAALVRLNQLGFKSLIWGHKMDLFTQITKVYPELMEEDFGKKKVIELQDDGDGIQYINKWNYSKPLPEGMRVGK